MGLLIEFADSVGEEALARCRGILQAIENHPPEGLTDVTAAYGAVLLEFSGGENVSSREMCVRELLAKAENLPAGEAPLHEIPVCYNGPDLEELARRVRLAPDEVAALHAATVYNVYLIGFSPGFPYLGPLDPRLHVPRRESPRTRVAPGSVAIGGEHTGIYSVSSPGGWWLIGHTKTEIFSPALAGGDGDSRAFLLRQGDRVRFVPRQP